MRQQTRVEGKELPDHGHCPPLACDSGAGSALWLAAKGSASARAASDATAEAYFNHPATLSSAQMASTGWRVRTTADCLPWTSTSVGSEREL